MLCSFDPAGEDAVNDLDVQKDLFTRFRAVIWERGVKGDGQAIVRVLATSTTRLRRSMCRVVPTSRW